MFTSALIAGACGPSAAQVVSPSAAQAASSADGESNGVANSAGIGVYELQTRSYVFGIFGSPSVDLRDICGEQPVLEVVSERQAIDYLLSVASLGIYYPRHLRVTCLRAASP